MANAGVSRILLLVLYVLGLVLLLAGFLLLISPAHRTPVAWLDLAAIAVAYSIVCWGVPSVLAAGRGFHTRVPVLAILMAAMPLYCLAVAAFIYYGAVLPLGFRLQLVLHCVLLLLLLSAFALGLRGGEHIAQTDDAEASLRQGLNGLRAALEDCEAALRQSLCHDEALRQRILRLKEDARYLSPGNAPLQTEFEAGITGMVRQISQELRECHDDVPPPRAVALLGRTEELMQARRNSSSR